MQHADLIIVSARLWDNSHLDADALAVGDGRVLATGGSRDILRLRSPETRVIDVDGRRVIPGLIDSHLHLVRAGRTWADEVRWDDAGSLEEALGLVRAKAEELGPGRWVGVMGGWHPNQFEERCAPTRAALDEAAPDNPLFVQRAYAEAFANSRAMTALGWGEASAPDGRVTGPADMAALRARLAVSDDQAMVGTEQLLRELNRLGLTGAIDASGFGVTMATYDAFRRLFAEGERGFRARFLLGAPHPGSEFEDVERIVAGVSLDEGDDFVRYLGAGEVLDYAAHDLEGLAPKDITGRTAALREMSQLLAGQGWPVHLHSILDSSITTLLDAWEALDEVDLSELRWAICHADQIGDENLRRVRDLGVGITIQNGMSMRGLDCAPTWGDRLVNRAPPLRAMLDLGIPVAAGTDGTVACTYNPWRCIAWMVSGESLDGAPARSDDQRLDIDEALRLYTSAGAWFSFEEETRGTLRPGSHADLAVLSHDPIASTHELASIESVLTVVGGRVVHSAIENGGPH
jgi:predicted amidohydrolase YtcJ